ncbi:MAG TPA: TonB-dependent receptor [Vicinamibacterales bacterium]
MIKRLLFTAGLILAATPLFAQATATINGRVVDQGGAVLPGATITVTDASTGVSRDTVSNNEGIYSVPGLVAGTYGVKAELPGFAPQTRNNIVLPIGTTLTVDLQLGLAGVQENVTVSGTVPLVETTQSVVAASILQTEVQQLPMLNRSMSAMMNLLPGAREVPGTTSAHGFSSSFVSFGGSTGRNFNMLVDGTDNKEDNCGGTFIVYSLDGVQEFKTLTTGANAEYGRGSATVLVSTKSGGNVLHGSVFGYGRNENLIATDYFSKPENGGFGKQPFSRAQYGGSLGGPIIRDHAWFFGSYERIAQTFTVPRSPSAYTQLAYLEPLNINVLNSHSITQPSRDSLSQAKVNFQLSHDHAAWFRYSSEYSYIDNDFLGSTGALLAYSPQYADHNHQITWNMAGGWTWVINPTTVNQFSLSYMSYTHDNYYPACPLTPGSPYGVNACLQQRLIFPTVSTGQLNAFPLWTDLDNKLEFKEDYSKQIDRHSLKFGADYMMLPIFGGIFGPSSPGNVSFFDDPSVIANNSNGKYPLGFYTPGIVRSITQTSLTIGDYSSSEGSFTECQVNSTADCAHNNWSNPDWAIGAYLQDDFKLNSRMTLNLGLRWDAYDYFTRQLPNNRVYQTLQAIGSPYGALPQIHYDGFAPRLGIAWDLHGDGKNVVRGSYGKFLVFGLQNSYYIRNILSQPIIYTQSTIVDPAVGVGPLANFVWNTTPLPLPPGAPTTLPPGNSTAGYWYDPNLRDERDHQFHGGMTHLFAHDTVLSVDYTHTLGHDGWRQLDINPLINGVRPLAADLKRVFNDPNLLGQVFIIASPDRSLYDEVAVHLERRFSQATALQVNYTLAWARGMGGLTDGALTTGPAAPYPQTASPTGGDIYAPWEWGPTAFDERHRVVVAGNFTLPWAIDVSPSVTAATARPYTQYRAVNPSGDGSLQVLGSDGNPAGINNARGIPLFNANARVTKNFAIVGDNRISVFAEFFNITNRANFGNQYFGNAFSPATYNQPASYLGGFGAVSTLPNSFQVQFGARLSF